MFSVDVRSRLDSEVDQIDLDAWIDDQLPLLVDQNSLIASEGAQILGCRPLGIRVSKNHLLLFLQRVLLNWRQVYLVLL